MANYSQLKAAIADVIKTNGTKAITGQVLQDTLNSIVSVIGANYTFAGIATPSTNPSTPDQNVVYVALEAGTYTNFNATVLPKGITLLVWNGSWSVETLYSVGDTPVTDSSALMESGAANKILSGLIYNEYPQQYDGVIGLYYINGSGVWTSDNNSEVRYYQVNKGEIYKIKHGYNVAYSAYAIFDEAPSTNVQPVLCVPHSTSNNIDYVLIPQDGYLAVSGNDSYNDKPQIWKAADINNVIIDISDYSLTNRVGAVIMANGTISNTGNSVGLRLFALKAGRRYKVEMTFIGGYAIGALFSDKDLNTLIRPLIKVPGSSSTTTAMTEYIEPDTDCYVAFNVVPEYEELYPFAFYEEIDLSDVTGIEEKYPVSPVSEKMGYLYLNMSGTMFSANKYYKVEIFALKAGHKYFADTTWLENYYVGGLFSDIGCTEHIGAIGWMKTGAALRHRRCTVIQPDTDCYAAMNVVYAYPDIYPFKFYELLTEQEIVSLHSQSVEKLEGEQNVVDCIGDSLTAGGQWISTIKGLAPDFIFKNLGAGGDTTLESASRYGTYPIIVAPVTIPASGGVNIVISSPIVEAIYNRSSFYPGRQSDPWKDRMYQIEGIWGFVTHSGDGSGSSSNHTYTFTRVNAGDAVTVKKTEMLPVEYSDDNNHIKIVWLGTNDTPQDIGIDKWLMMLDAIIGKTKRYLVLSMTAKSIMSNIVEINQAAYNHFGTHFLDIRDYLINYGLTDAGITPTSQDEQDIANGEIPTSLRQDAVHLNTAGYTVVGQQIFAQGRRMNYW